MLSGDATITANRIEFAQTGSTITAIASDYAGAAGANPTITTFDELWGFTSERAHRLWDEMVPPPTRRLACRLTVTYAGFEGESELLEGIYKRGIAGGQIAPDLYAAGGLLMYWTHDFTAPWQTEEWRSEMREAHRPNAYLRQIENRWVTSEESFIPIEWYDRCVDPAATPLFADRRLRVWAGVDASVKRDSTAIVLATYDRDSRKVRLVTTGSSGRARRTHSISRRRSSRHCSTWRSASISSRSGTTRTKWPRPLSGSSRSGCRWSNFPRRRAT